MWQILRRNPRALGAALLLHLLLAALLLIGVDWLATPDKAPTKPRVVQATIVDSKAIEAETAVRQAEAEHKAEREAQRRAETKRKAEREAQRQAEAKRKAEREAQRQAEAKRKAEREAQRRAEAKRKAEREAQRQAEAKRKAEREAQRQAEAKRKAEREAQRQAEAKRKAEREAQRRAEAKRKAEREAQRQAETKRKAEEAEARRAREEDLQAALEAEQAAGALSVYTSAIRDRIRQTWVRQPGMRRDLSCLVEVRLIPGGEVIPAGVQVIRSSGNPAFDQSVVTAIYKASPLPVPSGRSFEQFRNLRLTFKP